MIHEEECSCDTCLTATLRAENERLRRRVEEIEAYSEGWGREFDSLCDRLRADERRQVAGEIAEFVRASKMSTALRLRSLADAICTKYGLDQK